MADIILIQPAYSRVYGFKKDTSSILPSLGLMYLSSYLKNKGFTSKILDLEIESNKRLIEILTASSCKIFGITGVTSLFPEVVKLAKKIKSYNRNNIVIFGGSHASAVKEKVLSVCNDIDIVVFGEGEETLYEILQNKDLSTIKGIAYRLESEKIAVNNFRKFIDNLDSLPFPNHLTINYKKYTPSLHRYLGKPFAVMITSRGCSFSCNYCGAQTVWGSKVRYRSVRNILSEIDFLKAKFNIQNIVFWDDTITLNKNRFLELCAGLKRLGLGWSCNTRLDVVNKNVLKKMKSAGCKNIFYGVESSNKKILKLLGRTISLQKMKEIIDLTKKIGLRCTASMMVGVPFDTSQQIERNIKYMIYLNPDFAFFSPFAPHPGIPLYKYCIEHKIILPWEKWLNENFEGLPLNHPTANRLLTRKKIQEYLQKAYTMFYSRKRFFLEREKIFKEPWELKALLDLKRKFWDKNENS